MNSREEKYWIDSISFFDIRNRNELRVIKEIRRLMELNEGSSLSPKDWQDVYALALNALPSRYTQTGTIVLRDPVHKDNVADAVQDAIALVHVQPKI